MTIVDVSGRRRERLGRAVLGAVVYHAVLLVLAILAARDSQPGQTTPVKQAAPSTRIVWLIEPGPGGGGGGGGSETPAPPRQAELPGEDALTVPAVTPTDTEPPQLEPHDAPEVQRVTIPAKRLADAIQSLSGVIEPRQPALTVAAGEGRGGGTGTGAGTGMGPGEGSGLGDGAGRGTGGGTYDGGGGAMAPTAIYRATPRYTEEAMRARIQGAVLLECVVQVDGRCSDIRVIRSLDAARGLDHEAIKAAEQWRFEPGRRRGTPVPVPIYMELAFTIH